MLYYIREIKRHDRNEFLENVTKSNDNYVSSSAALILAQLGEYKISFDVFLKQVDSSDSFIRIISIIGLAYINDEKSLNIIEVKLSDTNKKVKDVANEIFTKQKK